MTKTNSINTEYKLAKWKVMFFHGTEEVYTAVISKKNITY